MKKDPISESDRQPAPLPGRARKSVLILTAIVGLGAVALVVVASKHPKSGEPKPTTNAMVAEKTPVEITAVHPVAETSPAPSTQVAIPEPVSAPDHAAIARQLIKSLSEVDIRPGQLTPEKAEKWHHELEQLIEQGTAVVPPLQEFFESHADVRFDAGPGTNLLEEPSLRVAFLKVLFDVPAPDNVYLQEEVLRTTTDPTEVALLARQLEAQEPGKYRDLIFSTAQISLAQMKGGVWPGRDASPLLKIIKQHGAAGAK